MCTDRDRKPLRRALREARRAIAPKDRIAAAESIAPRLLSLPFAPQRGLVAGYWASDGEMPLHAWQMRLPADVAYCLPVLGDDGLLRFAPWYPGMPLRNNRFGIPEPETDESLLLDADQIDLVVVPLVGFDLHGHRLGMGGGWYDRSFAFRQSRPGAPFLVGAAFSSQRVEALAPASWDVRLDAVCTERDTHLIEPCT